MKHNESGYTMLEMVAVVIIIGLLLTITVPSLEAVFHRLTLEDSAMKMARYLRYSQQMAVNNQEWYLIHFQHDHNRYVIRRSGEIIKTVKLPAGIDLGMTNFSGNELFFYPTGAPSAGGSIPIQNDEDIVFVRVSVGAGRVRVDDNEVE